MDTGIPISIFLIPYAIFLVIFFVFAFFSLYHMFRFGVTNFTTFFMSFAFIALSVIILFISYEYIAGIDWQRDIQIFDIFGKSEYIP